MSTKETKLRKLRTAKHFSAFAPCSLVISNAVTAYWT